MIRKFLDKIEKELENEFLKNGIEDIHVMSDIHTTDLTDTTGDEIVRLLIGLEDNSYNVFVREVRFKNEESKELLYKNIVESILECEKENKSFKMKLRFLLVRLDVFDLGVYYSEAVILTTQNAMKIYNTIMEEDSSFFCSSIEDFENRFRSWIFKIGNIKVINILNVFYKLS